MGGWTVANSDAASSVTLLVPYKNPRTDAVKKVEVPSVTDEHDSEPVELEKAPLTNDAENFKENEVNWFIANSTVVSSTPKGPVHDEQTQSGKKRKLEDGTSVPSSPDLAEEHTKDEGQSATEALREKYKKQLAESVAAFRNVQSSVEDDDYNEDGSGSGRGDFAVTMALQMIQAEKVSKSTEMVRNVLKMLTLAITQVSQAENWKPSDGKACLEAANIIETLTNDPETN